MAAEPEGGVDITSTGTDAESLDDLVKHDRLVLGSSRHLFVLGGVAFFGEPFAFLGPTVRMPQF